MSQQQPAESFKMNLGSLRSSIELKLHTYHAVRIWQGGQPTGKPGYTVPSMQAFFGKTNEIKMGSQRDNPYADWWMIQIEEKLNTSKHEMQELSGLLDKLIKNIPEQMSVSENLNQKPYITPLYCANHMAFQAVYLLEAYDSMARKVLLANHLGLLSRTDMEGFLDQGAHMLRSLYHTALSYKNAGVTRDDMAAKNARAAAAVEKLGMPPQDILEGTRRSDFAPTIIRTAAGSGMNEGADADLSAHTVNSDDSAGEFEQKELPQSENERNEAAGKQEGQE